MRLFVAINFPQEVHTALLAVSRALQRQGRGNFTRPEHLHMTLCFIGETSHVDKAKAAIDAVKSNTFPLSFRGLGHFDDLYWVGINRSEALIALQAQVAEELRIRGFTLENRPFKPHLTLCRQFRPFGELDIAAVNRTLELPSCTIHRIQLLSSSRPNGKLIYTELCSKALS